MLVVGLTGGIGSGKSTFAVLLAERGAQVIDADALGRDALRPSQPAWHAVVGQFGDEVLAATSLEIDRKVLARIVFQDPKKLAALNAIAHPVIFQGIADRLDALRHTDDVVILDAALIFEAGLDKFVDVVVAVVSSRKLRADRLERDRNMGRADITARMDAQLPSEEIERRADIVVHNGGSLKDLAAEAERAWDLLLKLRDDKQ